MIRRLAAAAPLVILLTLAGCAYYGNRWNTDYILIPEGQIEILSASPGVAIPRPPERYFPGDARGDAVSGNARVWCTVGLSGALEACQAMEEHPAGRHFGAAAKLLTQRGKANPALAPPGSQIEVTVAFRAQYWVDLDCELTVERVTRDCRVAYQIPRNPTVGERAAREAEGRAPPVSVHATHPGRVRWRATITVSIDGE